jgi:cyanate lyase
VRETQQTVFMITHDVDEAILLADRILLMSNGPRARVAEVVVNTMPRDRTRGTIHHDPQYYRIRNHLVDFLDDAQANAVVELFGLPAEAALWLERTPYKGSLPTSVPTDPLIYRFYELISVYGTTFKELIHEEFGDGIMSAIDFKMDLQREPDPKGDRVQIVMSGKFLSYKTY